MVFVCTSEIKKEEIKIDLIQAIQKQIQFCEEQDRYKCGIFVSSRAKRDIVGSVLKKIIPQYKLKSLRIDSIVAEVTFLNGNTIRTVMTNDNSHRGHGFNGVIVDSDTEQEVINCIVIPYLRPLHNEDGTYKRDDNSMNRFMMVDISVNDIIKSEKVFNNREMFEKEHK